MTRKECLDKAAECVLQDRNREYGEPERSFSYIADLWSAYLRTKIEPYDAAAMMALFKLARLRFNPYYEDGWADLAGYAACGAELAGAEKAREDATRKWGEEYKKLREQAEGGCCQNGKDHANPRVVEWVNKWNEERKREEANPLSFERQARVFAENNPPEEPEFKPGDAVEWNSIGKSWLPAVYEREFGDFGHCVVRLPDGRERIVSKADLRKAEANYPENPDSSPEFQRGDKVQYRAFCSDGERWLPACYERVINDDDEPTILHVVTNQDGRVLYVNPENLRPTPKAEGCEDLVQDKESDVDRVFGTLKKRPAPEYDAPQTTRELFDRIIANNPATFKARTPTGEELAEIAEEEGHG